MPNDAPAATSADSAKPKKAVGRFIAIKFLWLRRPRRQPPIIEVCVYTRKMLLI
jgi:hypothetical protein